MEWPLSPRRIVLTLSLLLAPRCLAGQDRVDSAGSAGAAPADTAPRAPVVQAIQIYREDIFDTDETDGWLARLLNGLHIRTRASVVRRELLFRAGERYDSARVAETARNLRRLGIFRDVEVDSASTPSGLVVWIVTQDGWSTKPELQFRSTGGQEAYSIGLLERNLLGTATQAAVRFKRDPDRTTTQFSFRQPRLLASRIALDLQYHDASDGESMGLELEQPFYSLSARSSFGVAASSMRGRVLQFREGDPEPAATWRRRFALLRLSAARSLRGGPTGYLRVGAGVQLRRDDFVRDSTPGPFPETITGVLTANVEWSLARFRVTEGLAAFGRKEDVDMSTTVSAALSLAPKAFGYERDGIGLAASGRIGSGLGAGFLNLSAAANGLVTAAGLDSGQVRLAATLALQPHRRHTAVAHLSLGWQEDPRIGEEFDLGLGAGPRAFGAHAFTGDRLFFTTAEYRYTLHERLVGLLGVGVAGFIDHGGAWFSGSRRRTGTNAGLGLRLGQIRSTDAEPARLDLAYRFGNEEKPAGWVFVVGKGWVF
ncbi:MAG TPA: hypothetical protein VNK43_12440 [Gemmatimonadales bacterium]|nr:hypothetical protein [Gemmatimonadales bacterium]